GLEDLQVLARQQVRRAGDVDRVPGKLDAVFGSANRRRANALTRWKQRMREATRVDALAQRHSETPAQVEEIALLASVHVLADAAGEHHAGDALDGIERIREPQGLDLLRRGTLRERRDDRIGHP